MSNLVKDKNILVMGVANKWSIAWGIATQLYKNGANLLFSYYGERSLRSLEKLVAEAGIENPFYVECDVTKDEEIENTFKTVKEKVGVLHGVAHCIAHADTEDLKGSYVDTSREGYAMAQDISVYSLVAVSKYAKPLMTEGGNIITLTYYGGEKVVKNYNVMGVAKAALDASVQYLAADLGPENIRINGISAGPIKTLAAKGVGDFNTILNDIEKKSPMRKNVTAVDIGNTAVYLLSELSGGVTGEIIHVDSGYSILGL